ncbi:MAG: hypothetical protein N3I35_12535 [Clostridia bacterium]|nr:hypothetical protein [Clostridia bacterium]
MNEITILQAETKYLKSLLLLKFIAPNDRKRDVRGDINRSIDRIRRLRELERRRTDG